MFSWLPFSTTIGEGGPRPFSIHRFRCSECDGGVVVGGGREEDEAANRVELQEVSLSFNIRLNSFKI